MLDETFSIFYFITQIIRLIILILTDNTTSDKFSYISYGVLYMFTHGATKDQNWKPISKCLNFRNLRNIKSLKILVTTFWPILGDNLVESQNKNMYFWCLIKTRRESIWCYPHHAEILLNIAINILNTWMKKKKKMTKNMKLNSVVITSQKLMIICINFVF